MAVGPDGILYLPTANAPVIEYDPTTGACLGARIWDVVLNLSLHSRDLTQTAWSKSGITATRDQVGANGVSNTATRLTATSSDGTCLQTITSASATRVSGFYIRRITGTGTVEITQNGGATWTAVTLTSAFARYSIASATITNPQIGFRIRSNGDEIAVDFAQLQSSAILGPPVATAGVTASSTADVWSITGADFSRIFNATELTIYTEATSQSSADSTIWQIDDNSGNANRFTQYFASNILRSRTTISNSQNDIDRTGVAVGVPARGVYGIKASDYAAVLNGGTIGTSAHALPSATMSILRIGSVHPGGAVMLNGYIRELAIFRSRRPNANLQAMTS